MRYVYQILDGDRLHRAALLQEPGRPLLLVTDSGLEWWPDSPELEEVQVVAADPADRAEFDTWAATARCGVPKRQRPGPGRPREHRVSIGLTLAPEAVEILDRLRQEAEPGLSRSQMVDRLLYAEHRRLAGRSSKSR